MDLSECKEENLIGEGAYSNVYLIKNKDGIGRAIKVTDETEDSLTEYNILKEVGHPYIVKVFGRVLMHGKAHLIMEHIPWSLEDVLEEQHRFDEQAIKELSFQILQAIKYLHSKNIVHHDVKEENILYDQITHTIRLADFGFAEHLPSGKKGDKYCGSPTHMAPEIVNCTPYRFKIDIWSIGVVLFRMSTGRYPFLHHDEEVIFKLIRSARYYYLPLEETELSVALINLTKRMLIIDPKIRISAMEALAHPFFNDSTPQ